MYVRAHTYICTCMTYVFLSGELEVDEVKELVGQLGTTLTDEEAKNLFQVMDADGSGSVDFKEFAMVILHQKAKGSGNINYRELAEKMFAIFDQVRVMYTVWCVCARVYACNHVCRHMQINTDTYIHACTQIHTYINAHIHTYMHACIHAYMWIYAIHTHMHPWWTRTDRGLCSRTRSWSR